MGDVIAFNGKQLTTNKVVRANQHFTVYSDGAIRYTNEGIGHFGPMFREHGIDIRKVQTEDDHTVVVDICASQSLHEIGEKVSFDDLEAQLLRAIMLNQDNEEAKTIKSKIEAKKRLNLHLAQ